MGSLAEMRELMELVRNGKIQPAKVESRPIDQINETLQDMKKGSLPARVRSSRLMDFLEGKVEILDDVLIGKAGSRDLLADLFLPPLKKKVSQLSWLFTEAAGWKEIKINSEVMVYS